MTLTYVRATDASSSLYTTSVIKRGAGRFRRLSAFVTNADTRLSLMLMFRIKRLPLADVASVGTSG